jgi:septal ring factor EnvC (AmiA/AmiB activator)
MTDTEDVVQEIDELLARRAALKAEIAECNAKRQPFAEHIAAAEEGLARAKAELALIDAETLAAIAPLQAELDETVAAMRRAERRHQQLALEAQAPAIPGDGDVTVAAPGVESEEVLGQIGG